MNSSLIGKIEKAKRYAQERGRVQFKRLEADFRGSHDSHRVTFEQGRWHCDCSFFALYDVCSHTMAMQRILGEMLPAEKEEASLAARDAS